APLPVAHSRAFRLPQSCCVLVLNQGLPGPQGHAFGSALRSSPATIQWRVWSIGTFPSPARQCMLPLTVRDCETASESLSLQILLLLFSNLVIAQVAFLDLL